MRSSALVFSRARSLNICKRSLARHTQYGLTLVELLVALVISLLIALAAISALTVSRQGFNTLDASSQLRDNGRFASDLLQRLGVQSGFKDRIHAATQPTLNLVGAPVNPEPNIFGFNNALFANSQTTATARTTGVVGFGSDVLILRYQTAEMLPGSVDSDGSMIDCAGNAPSGSPFNRNARSLSVIHVNISQGEPSLMCSVIGSSGTFVTQPIIQGVENFQVLYGTDGVTAGVAPPTSAASAAAISDSVPDRYFRADQLTVVGDASGTNANWRRVRSIRIGLVLRGPANSQQERVSQTFYPFGRATGSSSGVVGSAMSNTTALDPGTVFTPTADGRLRQVVTFTVHLRNDQGL